MMGLCKNVFACACESHLEDRESRFNDVLVAVESFLTSDMSSLLFMYPGDEMSCILSPGRSKLAEVNSLPRLNDSQCTKSQILISDDFDTGNGHVMGTKRRCGDKAGSVECANTVQKAVIYRKPCAYTEGLERLRRYDPVTGERASFTHGITNTDVQSLSYRVTCHTPPFILTKAAALLDK